MNTHDHAPSGHDGGSTPAFVKRAYQTPQVIELGDVRDLTRGSTGGTKFDTLTTPQTKV